MEGIWLKKLLGTKGQILYQTARLCRVVTVVLNFFLGSVDVSSLEENPAFSAPLPGVKQVAHRFLQDLRKTSKGYTFENSCFQTSIKIFHATKSDRSHVVL